MVQVLWPWPRNRKGRSSPHANRVHRCDRARSFWACNAPWELLSTSPVNALLVEGSARRSQYPVVLTSCVGFQRHLLPSLGCRSEQTLMSSFLIVHAESLPPLTCTHTWATHTLCVLRLYICINAGLFQHNPTWKILEKWSIPGFIPF